MKNKKCRVAAYILGILPLIVLGAVYFKLPEMVPVHWNVDGTVEYGNRMTLWIFFSIGLFMTVLGDVLPKIDPRKENYKKFGKYYDRFILMIVVFLDSMCVLTLVETMAPGTMSVGKYTTALVGVVLIITGNLLPKIKSNFYIGVKTPWALSNTDIWNRTQRLGGRIMFGWGVAMVIGGILLQSAFVMWIVIAGAVLMTLVTTVMSYVWYRKLER